MSTTDPPADPVMVWARILAQANFGFSIGETGLMAISPENFSELFEAYFRGEKVQQRYRHLGQTVMRELNDRHQLHGL